MQVRWTDFAWEMLSQTADDILAEYGYRSYIQFLDDVDAGVNTLCLFPLSGKEEPLLEGRPLQYRSLVIEKLNKIVYVLDEDQELITITDFWNVRREPQLLTSSI